MAMAMKTSLKKWIRSVAIYFIHVISSHSICQMLVNFSGVKS